MDEKDLSIELIEKPASIDFESLQLQEESSVLSESLIKPLNHDYIKDEVLFIVVRAQNKALSPDLPSLNLCGKSMLDWVLLAGSNCQQMTLDDYDNIILKVKSINTDKKYIALFYSDIPLFDKSSFFKIMDYFTSRDMNFLQLSRGFVAKSEFLKSNSEFAQSATESNDVVPLFRCDSSQKLIEAFNTLKSKILNYHIKNGVTIFGKETVFIDADVEIDSGVVIYPNNILKGECVISEGSILLSGNIIENSIVLNDCQISNSYIKDSKITENKSIENDKVIKEVR